MIQQDRRYLCSTGALIGVETARQLYIPSCPRDTRESLACTENERSSGSLPQWIPCLGATPPTVDSRDILGITRAHATLAPGNKAVYFCLVGQVYIWRQNFHFLCSRLHLRGAHVFIMFRKPAISSAVTVVLTATTTNPNTENPWRLFCNTMGTLKIINGLWPPVS